MRAVTLLLIVCLSLVAGVPKNPQKIVGGTEVSISQYPYAAALLYGRSGTYFWLGCGGSIINNRAILSAAHCFYGDEPREWISRIGSTWFNRGGVVHQTSRLILHPSYNHQSLDNDVAILHSTTAFAFSSEVAAGTIAGSSYNLADNQVVWAIGWGAINYGSWLSENLRHVQIWTVNQNTCASRYAELGNTITENMLCAGWLDVGGRDQCQGDSGGPLLHNNVIVGVCSWGQQCALARYPGVNARVSRVSSWIQANA